MIVRSTVEFDWFNWFNYNSSAGPTDLPNESAGELMTGLSRGYSVLMIRMLLVIYALITTNCSFSYITRLPLKADLMLVALQGVC